MADLGGNKCVGKVVIWNRIESSGCCGLYTLSYLSLPVQRPGKRALITYIFFIRFPNNMTKE